MALRAHSCSNGDGFHPEPKDAPAQQVGFVPARVVLESRRCQVQSGWPAAVTIEIEFAARAWMRITGGVDGATLKVAVAALDGRRR
jgi:transposase